MKHERLLRLVLATCLAFALVLALLDFLLLGLDMDPFISLGITAALFLLGGFWRMERSVPLCIPALGLCLVSAVLLDRRGGDTFLPGLCALFLLLLWLVSGHIQGLRQGLHNMPGEPPMDWPRGVREKNGALLLLFLALALALSSLAPAERGADRLWHRGVAGLERVTGSLAADLKERAMRTPEPTGKPRPTHTPEPTPEPRPELTPEPTPEPEQVLPRPLTWSAPVLTAAVAALILLRPRRRRRKKSTGEPEPYEEETERLRRRSGPEKRGRRDRDRGKGLRWKDLPDDRARVRYVWFRLQTGPAGKRYGAALTPRELGQALGGEEVKALAEQYNLARYAPDKALSPNAGELAYAVFRRRKRRDHEKKE